MKPLTALIRRHATSLWGQKHFVSPALVDWIHGDGLQVIWFEPLDSRPNYYVVRIDSKIQLDNCGSPPVFCDEVLGDLMGAIESEYGQAHEEWEHPNGRTYQKHNCFPALNNSCGESWGLLVRLREPDKRAEYRVRRDLRRAKSPPKVRVRE
jgi:hypothetical protein